MTAIPGYTDEQIRTAIDHFDIGARTSRCNQLALVAIRQCQAAAQPDERDQLRDALDGLMEYVAAWWAYDHAHGRLSGEAGDVWAKALAATGRTPTHQKDQ